MTPVVPQRARTARNAFASLLAGAALLACGGGTGTQQDSGANKTYLSVQASDADGDTLQYQWRVTAGTIDNRNSPQAVWTMPDGPGLHFAYVTVTDGRGGSTEQQYAVATDTLGTTVPDRPALDHTPPAVTEADGFAVRLRFEASGAGLATQFADPAAAPGAALVPRTVYLADVQVTLRDPNGQVLFAGLSDLGGEVALPHLPTLAPLPTVPPTPQKYTVQCATSADAPQQLCDSFNPQLDGLVRIIVPAHTDARNLRLFGHVALADGGLCGDRNEFFGTQAVAQVQLQAADGTALGAPLRVNRFGDYALDASVQVDAPLRLQVRCAGYAGTVAIAPVPGGFTAATPVEVSHRIPNSRPQVLKMVANGPEGNVRGKMITPEPDAASNVLPGPNRFLSYKGQDTKQSACLYYRAIGAVKDCDTQGNMNEPITLADWLRHNQFGPFKGSNIEVAANYINKRDLNLVRRMVASKVDDSHIAFYVCNHPGPLGSSQREIDEVLDTGLNDQKRVACVAMEWTPTAGVNSDKPYTKFLTFGPDGSLLASINLDGRGEKYMPGSCVACHGGAKYSVRFADKGSPSAYLASRFLPFDTGNYYFSTAAGLSEAAQSDSIYELNKLVALTEPSATTATSNLINGWYAGGSKVLDKAYVPPQWALADTDGDPKHANAARFYREVVGTSCRTCHTSLGTTFDWDSTVLDTNRAQAHVCGGTPDVGINASMPNALISRDRLLERVRSDATLAALMKQFLGCDTALPDPAYPSR